MSQRTESGDLLTDLVMRTFRLNGQFLAAAERIARPAGLTAAWWQVLGAVLAEPAPVAGIARSMGLARQSVQRIADLLVDKELAEYVPNPAHRRAKLLRPTDQGLDAIARLRGTQARWADEVAGGITPEELRAALDVIDRVLKATDN
ncbi:DNA-binding MarR family transcriptional regulator [Herbihabitans rhizosphaerae]|uniref:DNA-binding MarR family transcriptional regulator n=1 Tax=Herbihabitans rhizosphaerae TaxID=1872711 RepID=A0A4Q7KJV2_9PSEU|nr:MarR family transcriptional regulator [Herbihabitans rhizosphaerae]RZS36477.1 DNA-binding MarR family transcriptional regulator [Herbihabitans rhizosphaerae]